MQTPFFPLRLRAWLKLHRLAMVGTALGCLGIFCLLPAHDNQLSPRPSAVALSPRQVRGALRAQAARVDSIRRESQKIPALIRARDSALLVARQQNIRANHLLTLLTHEATPTTTPASARSTEQLARALAAYQPGNYALDSLHSLR